MYVVRWSLYATVEARSLGSDQAANSIDLAIQRVQARPDAAMPRPSEFGAYGRDTSEWVSQVAH